MKVHQFIAQNLQVLATTERPALKEVHMNQEAVKEALGRNTITHRKIVNHRQEEMLVEAATVKVEEGESNLMIVNLSSY